MTKNQSFFSSFLSLIDFFRSLLFSPPLRANSSISSRFACTMTTSEAKPRSESKEIEERERRRAGQEAEDGADEPSTSSSSSDEDEEEGNDGNNPGRGYQRLGDALPSDAADDEEDDEKKRSNAEAATAAAATAAPLGFSVLRLAPEVGAPAAAAGARTTAANGAFRSIIDESVPTASGLLEARSEARGMEEIDAAAVAAAFLRGGAGAAGKEEGGKPPLSSSSTSLLTPPPAPEWARGLEGEALRAAALERVRR